MEPLKIALIVDHFLPQIGGIEVHVGDLAKELRIQGHDVHVITGFPGPNEIHGIRVHRLKTPFFPWTHSLLNPKLLREVKGLFLQENFQVLHCHNSIVSPLAYVALYLANKQKIPAVLTTHSLFSVGSISFFRILGPLLKMAQWPLVITGVSQEATERLKRAFPKHEIHTLPNGIHSSRWKVAKQPSYGSKITTVMRLHKKKRPHKLLEAIPKLNKELTPEQRPQVTFIGDGPMRNFLENKAQTLGIRDQVEFTGWIPREKIKDILAHTSVFVLPSPWETLSLTALEACSAGLPVIAMKKSGLKDVISHGRHGFLSENYQDLVPHMAKILSDKNLGEELGRNAQVEMSRFDWTHIINKNLNFYQMAINQTRSAKKRA